MPASEDDPEVQENGFEVILEDALGVQKEACQDFFDNWFEPEDTWDENLDRFFEYARTVDVITEDEDALREKIEG